MSLKVRRPSQGSTDEDFLFRIRALEAKLNRGVGGPIPVDMRNVSVDAWFALQAASNYTLGVYFMRKNVNSSLTGVVRVPDNATGEFAIQVGTYQLASGSGNTQLQVYTAAVADGDSMDFGLTPEAAQNVPADLNLTIVRFPPTGGLASGVGEGDYLFVQLLHNGAAGGDTATYDTLIAGVWLEV